MNAFLLSSTRRDGKFRWYKSEFLYLFVGDNPWEHVQSPPALPLRRARLTGDYPAWLWQDSKYMIRDESSNEEYVTDVYADMMKHYTRKL